MVEQDYTAARMKMLEDENADLRKKVDDQRIAIECQATREIKLIRERDAALGKASDSQKAADTAEERWRDTVVKAREARDSADRLNDELKKKENWQAGEYMKLLEMASDRLEKLTIVNRRNESLQKVLNEIRPKLNALLMMSQAMGVRYDIAQLSESIALIDGCRWQCEHDWEMIAEKILHRNGVDRVNLFACKKCDECELRDVENRKLEPRPLEPREGPGSANE